MMMPSRGMDWNTDRDTSPVPGGKKIYLFGQGKSEEAAKRHNLPLLAQMPIDPKLAALVDAGKIEEFEGTWLNAAADALEKTRKRAE